MSPHTPPNTCPERVLGQPERVTQRKDLDGDPDLDALRARRQGGGDDEGRR